MRRSMDDYCRC